MSKHQAIIRWTRTGPDFLNGKYSREHAWTFDGGLTVPASPSPSIVRAPWSNAASIDPEEAVGVMTKDELSEDCDHRREPNVVANPDAGFMLTETTQLSWTVPTELPTELTSSLRREFRERRPPS
jgi:hypothetical protein